MKALVLTRNSCLEYIEVPDPAFGPTDVVVRVAACGICGSDVHGMDGSSGRRVPPVIMGHEAADVIAEAGGLVRDWRPGQRVTFDSTIYCGEWEYCQQGLVNFRCSTRWRWEWRQSHIGQRPRGRGVVTFTSGRCADASALKWSLSSQRSASATDLGRRGGAVVLVDNVARVVDLPAVKDPDVAR